MPQVVERRYAEPDWTIRLTEVLSPGPYSFPASEPAHSGKSYEELELERRQIVIKVDRGAFLKAWNPLAILAGSDSIIEVVVGTEATSWHLHKALLINRSPFFKLALDGHFKGSSENKVILAEDESTIFALFVQWLYTSTFNALSSYDLIHAYILGDRLGTTDFKNKAIDQLHAANLWKCTFTPSEANTIFAFTTAGCGLRRLAVDSIALAFLTQVLDVQAEDWKSSFTFVEEMTEVMAAMARQVRGIWKDKPQTEYHDVEQRQAH